MTTLTADLLHLNIRDTGNTCDLTPGQLDWSPVMRSSLVNLDKFTFARFLGAAAVAEADHGRVRSVP